MYIMITPHEPLINDSANKIILYANEYKTLSIRTFIEKTLSIITLSIKTLSLDTLSIKRSSISM